MWDILQFRLQRPANYSLIGHMTEKSSDISTLLSELELIPLTRGPASYDRLAESYQVTTRVRADPIRVSLPGQDMVVSDSDAPAHHLLLIRHV